MDPPKIKKERNFILKLKATRILTLHIFEIESGNAVNTYRFFQMQPSQAQSFPPPYHYLSMGCLSSRENRKNSHNGIVDIGPYINVIKTLFEIADFRLQDCSKC